MADEAEVNLVDMSVSDRVVWFRQRLVHLPGTIVEIDGSHWKVLEHNGGLPPLMSDISGGQLGISTYRDLNGRLKNQEWRASDPSPHDSHQMVHRVLILPEDNLLPSEPSADATSADVTEPEDLDVEDLENAARALHWAASEIVTLRNRCDELTKENADLREQLTAAATEAQRHPRPPARVVTLFRDGLSEISGLRQP